jgi:hypothetical protein
MPRILWTVLVAALAVGLAAPAWSGDIERARRMHDRLVGVPASPERLAEMVRLMNEESVEAAALYALEHPAFYSVSLKNFVTPWTNEEQTVFAPLNDYTALVIGLIRDDVPFNQVLSIDRMYHGANGVVNNGYSPRNNLHYEQLEANRIDLSDPDEFVWTPQSQMPGSQVSSSDAAGVITTRAAAEAFFSAGTNRAMTRFTFMNFMCRDMEGVHDTTRPADRIRQDISRSPGGDSTIFLNSCIGCHAGMDPISGAFAYFEWEEGDEDDNTDNGRMTHSPGQVQEKYLINANTFPFGYVTRDNRWDNYWREGPNSALGWDENLPSGGYGAQSWGRELGNSKAFATCQVEKVFKHVCFRPDNSDEDRAAITAIAQDFMDTGYSMKKVFAQVAEYCTAGEAAP